jgi:hypothetical protein
MTTAAATMIAAAAIHMKTAAVSINAIVPVMTIKDMSVKKWK